MRHDVTAVWAPTQEQLFSNQKSFEEKALYYHDMNPEKATEFLTQYSMEWADRIVREAWKLGDHLWTRYDEKF